MIKAYVVKYLSDGILRVDGCLLDNGMLRYRIEGGALEYIACTDEWFRRKKEAVAAAQKKRADTIEGLKLHIEKLEALNLTSVYEARRAKR